MNTFTATLGIFFFLLAILVAISATILILRELRKPQPKPKPETKNIFHRSAPTTQTQSPTPKPVEPTPKPAPRPTPTPTPNAVFRKQAVMSKAENAFHYFLTETVGNTYLIETKMPLKDIFKRYGFAERGLYTMHMRGHIDFLLVDQRSKKPVLAIELDDWRHKFPDRQDMDRRKNILTETGNLKLLRFKVGDTWGEIERREILAALPEQTTHNR